jgi:hypothetical protein
MANPHFIGLVHSVLSSAQAALGDMHSPMVTRLSRDGLMARKTAEKSFYLLEMLNEKTQGNLDETERDALYQALSTLKTALQQLPESAEDLN